jgi:hypothetical protein
MMPSGGGVTHPVCLFSIDQCPRIQSASAGGRRLGSQGSNLRRRFPDELPDVQSLVGAWAPDNLIAVYDEIDEFGPKIASHMSVALHFKVDGKRFGEGIDDAFGELDRLVTLLNQVRDFASSGAATRLIRP